MTTKTQLAAARREDARRSARDESRLAAARARADVTPDEIAHLENMVRLARRIAASLDAGPNDILV